MTLYDPSETNPNLRRTSGRTITKMRFLIFVLAITSVSGQILSPILFGARNSPASPITLLTHTVADSNGNTATTSAIDTTGASFIALAIGSNGNNGNGAPGGISDATTACSSPCNSWTCGTAATSNTNAFAQVQICYVWNPTVGPGHTVTYTYSGCGCSIAFASFNNIKTASTPYDQENHGGTTPVDTTVSTGTITPLYNSELILTATSQFFTGEATPTDFTMIDSSPTPFSVYQGIGFAYRVQTTAVLVGATWTGDGNNSYRAAVIASIQHN